MRRRTKGTLPRDGFLNQVLLVIKKNRGPRSIRKMALITPCHKSWNICKRNKKHSYSYLEKSLLSHYCLSFCGLADNLLKIPRKRIINSNRRWKPPTERNNCSHSSGRYLWERSDLTAFLYCRVFSRTKIFRTILSQFKCYFKFLY